MRSDYIENMGISVNINQVQSGVSEANLYCTFYYYDNKYNFIKSVSNQLSNASEQNSIFAEEDNRYKYIRFTVSGQLYNNTSPLTPLVLPNYIIVNKTSDIGEWIEQDVMAGVNGSWVKTDDGI